MDSTSNAVTPVQRWLARGSAGLLVLTAAFVVVISVVTVSWPSLDEGIAAASIEIVTFVLGSLLFTSWNVAPMIAGAWFASLVKEYWPRGLGAMAVGATLIAVLTVTALLDFMASDSSTAALIFIFLPFPLWLVLGVSIGAAFLLQAVANRWVRRGAGPS